MNQNSEKLKEIIREILSKLSSPEVVSKINALKASNVKQSTLYHMKCIFPFVVDLELEIVQKHGYTSPEGFGIVEFINDVRQCEKEDFELFELHKELKANVMPDFSLISEKLNS